jgi:hypothetical protein
MVIGLNDWEYYKEILKPIFGSRKNWYRFCEIMRNKRLKILYGVVFE